MIPPKDAARKINIIFIFIFILGGLIVGRLFFLQVISGDYYESLSSRQDSSSSLVSPRRGDIYLQGKNGELITIAGTKEGYSVYVSPKI